jgi:hypothetical protein
MSFESKLTERQFFAASLTGIILLVLGLYMGFLRPKLQERDNLRQQIQTKTQQLQKSGYLLGEAPLLQKKRTIETEYQRNVQEWDTLTERLAVFNNQTQWRTVDVAKIDYKYYLYLTRLRLGKKAQTQQIEVPTLLGLQDTIDSNDVARELMLQLLAVEKLVDTAIEYGIADIRSIDPLPPVQHRVDEKSEVYMEEYPLRVIFEGDMQRLYRLWEAMFQPGRAMMLRNIAMAKTSLNKPDEVRMTATLSSFLFLQDAEDITVLQSDPSKKTAARGH